jgi:predicted house-cleaning noncanonical NTP pyrophosphatase (MazG superfamily)
VSLEKLVRDRIPEIMGIPPGASRTRLALPEERLPLLLEKLKEECAEVCAEPSLDEIADVLEVLRSLAAELGASWSDVEEVGRDKSVARGGFAQGVVLRTERSRKDG